MLYTDGLSEAADPKSDEEFGEKEMPALLEARADSELASVRDALIERAMRFSGGPLLTDDCTLVVGEVPMNRSACQNARAFAWSGNTRSPFAGCIGLISQFSL